RVVLGPNGEPLVPREVGESFWHGPAGKHAVRLDPQVVMEVSRLMAMNDKDASFCRGGGGRAAAGRRANRFRFSGSDRPWLRRSPEVPLAAVLLGWHTHPMYPRGERGAMQ